MIIECLAATILAGGMITAAQARPPDVVQHVQTQSDDTELTVTGEKADRSLKETPTSVSITTSRSIDDQNLASVYDVFDRAPNVMTDATRTSFSIRGVDAFNVAGGGDGALASLYLDGAAIPRLVMASGPLELYDVAQIEILRGAQSTVQGRNALAGAVIISTIDPSFDWIGKGRLLLTDRDGQRRASAVIGGPIIDDQVAFRLVGETKSADGLIRNITTHEDADRQTSKTLRGKLLLTPRVVPGLQVTAAFLYDEHQRGTFYSELDPPYAPQERVSTADFPSSKHAASSIGTLTIGYQISPGVTFRSVTNYSDISFRSSSDADRTPVPGQVSHIANPNKAFQQEVRLNFQSSWVDGLIGAFYLHERRDYYYDATQTLGLKSLGIDRQLQIAGLSPAAVEAVLNLYGNVIPIENRLTQPRITQNQAGFADLTFLLSNPLRLRVGLRYDSETQDRSSTQIVRMAGDLPDPTNVAVPAFAPIVGRLNDLLRGLIAGANSVEPIYQVRYYAWLPKIGLTYDAASNVSLSTTIQRGYRAGGAGFNEQRGESYAYAPEFTTSYEFSLRSTWFDKRLTINANLYRTDWKDQQLSVRLTPGSVYDTQIVNAGKSRLYGFEAEFLGIASRTVNFYAGVGYGSARFTKFDVSIGTLSASAQGKAFPRAPRWTLSAGATFSSPSGWLVNVNANHRSAFYQDIIAQDFRDIPSRTLVNAKIGWHGKHIGAFFLASNVFDDQKPEAYFSDLDGRRRGTLTEPRILGLSIEGRL